MTAVHTENKKPSSGNNVKNTTIKTAAQTNSSSRLTLGCCLVKFML